MKTWADIEQAALDEPLLFQIVSLVHRGDLTREQGLIAAVLRLVAVKNKQHEVMMEYINTHIPTIIIPKP